MVHVESGEVVVSQIAESNVYWTVFSWGATAKFSGGVESLNILARQRTAQPFVQGTTYNIDFGAKDAGQSAFHYDSYDEPTSVFTAPYGGTFAVAVTVRFLNSGVETVRFYRAGVIYDQENTFNANHTGIQTYVFNSAIAMAKGQTLYATVQTTAGGTGNVAFAQMSVSQLS